MYLYRKVLVLSLLMMSVGLPNNLDVDANYSINKNNINQSSFRDVVDCECDSEYSAGDMVICVESYGNITEGMIGTVVCGSDDGDPDILINWDNWSNGHNGNNHCQCGNGDLPIDSGYYVYCDNIQLLESDSGCTDPSACNYDPDAIEDDGSCAYEVDCAGNCGGDAIEDDCGVCDGGNSDMDCAGECFGDTYVDDCGVCDGGNADLDECGVCYGDNADMDCAGVCYGDAVEDSCGECGGDDSSCSGCSDPSALNYDPDVIIEDECCVYHEDVPFGKLADLNNDGFVNILDAVLMINFILDI